MEDPNSHVLGQQPVDRGKTEPLLSVVIPAYNEQDGVDEILRRVAAVDIDKEIIVIDDCSTDGTVDKIQQFSGKNPQVRLNLIVHQRNRGKTASVSNGLKIARGRMVVIQDADLEYNPHDFPRLIESILTKAADAVYGSRFMHKKMGSGLVTRLHRLVNRFLTFVSNLVTGLHLTDMETCYKMIRRDLLDGIEIKSTGFGFEVEITAKLARKGARIREVPISYARRGYGAGKKIGARDGLAALWWILRFALSD